MSNRVLVPTTPSNITIISEDGTEEHFYGTFLPRHHMKRRSSTQHTAQPQSSLLALQGQFVGARLI